MSESNDKSELPVTYDEESVETSEEDTSGHNEKFEDIDIESIKEDEQSVSEHASVVTRELTLRGLPTEPDDVFGSVEVDDETINPYDFINAEEELSYKLPPESEVEDKTHAGPAKARILYSQQHGYIYYLDEPVLGEDEKYGLEKLEEILMGRFRRGQWDSKTAEELLNERVTKERVREIAEKEISTWSDLYSIFPKLVTDIMDDLSGWNFDEEATERILYHLMQKYGGIGKPDPLTLDPHVEDIHLNSANKPIYIDYQHDSISDDKLMTNVVIDDDSITDYLNTLAQMSGTDLSATDPLASGALPDGSRIELVRREALGPSSRGAFTIRLFSEDPWTPVDLMKYDTFDAVLSAYFWMAVQANQSIMFAGGTGSGKTTSLNAISMFLPQNDKLISIEDTPEITLRQSNWLPHLTDSRGRGEGVTFGDLLKTSLRERPDYILLGEVRREGATTLFDAIASDHPSIVTFHAQDYESVVDRFVRSDEIGVSAARMASLDIIAIQQARENSEGNQVRRLTQVNEITGTNESSIQHQGEVAKFVQKMTGDDDMSDIDVDYSMVLEAMQNIFNVDEEDIEAKQVLGYDTQNDEYKLNFLDRDESGEISLRIQDSPVLKDIQNELGMSEEELENEFKNLVKLHEQMEAEKFDELDYRYFTDLVMAYQRDERAKENILEAAEEGELRKVAKEYYQAGDYSDKENNEIETVKNGLDIDLDDTEEVTSDDENNKSMFKRLELKLDGLFD